MRRGQERSFGPERKVDQLHPEWMLKSYAVNTVGPLLVAKAMHPHMANPSTIVNISARVGSIGDNAWEDGTHIECPRLR